MMWCGAVAVSGAIKQQTTENGDGQGNKSHVFGR